MQSVRLPEEGLMVGELLDLHLHRYTPDLHTLGSDASSQAQLEQALRVRVQDLGLGCPSMVSAWV